MRYLCEILRPFFLLCRIFGLFPLRVVKKESCYFEISYFWLTYSFIIVVICIIQTINSSSLIKTYDANGELPVILGAITECIYSTFSAILILCHIFRAPKIRDSLNHLPPLIDSGLICNSAGKILVKSQYIFTGSIIFYLVIQFLSLVVLNLSDSYTTDWNVDRFLIRFVTNIPFMFYLEFCTFCGLYIVLFACFEKMFINTLKFQPVHPSKGVISETNNKMTLLGLFTYQICSEDHILKKYKTKNWPRPVVIEKLRCLHEKICVSIRETNSAMNPAMLIMLTVELAVLVVHWYSVIIYLKYDNASIVTSTINMFNWVFIFTHSAGIFVFLRSGQQVISLFNGLSDFLLEYSTRHLTVAEHQQIRIFINKLRFSPVKFNASGVVNISNSLTAPIYGNVLTYVLVALQFRAPTN